MPWWVLFKVFQKCRLSKSIMPWTLFLQSFSRVYARIIFCCIKQVIMSWVIYDFSHTLFVCSGSITDCQSGRLLRHMWNLLEHMLYTCFFIYAIFYFCFTLRCLDEFCLKCFRKTGCQNLSCHELSSCKVFQEFVLGLDFIVFNKWLRV